MKFGPVPLSEAEGAILSHSLAGATRRLRKGGVLTAEDIAELAAAGHEEITVARLEPGDLHEDAAAERLAAALVPDPEAARLRLAKPFTGRVNIYATQNGVAEIDEASIHRANAVDPMISVATVAPWARMREGGMVATVKIISYAVPEKALRQAALQSIAALRLRPPAYKTASLIVSETTPGQAAAEQKGVEAIRARLSALDVELSEVIPAAHATQAIAEALRGASGESLFILTASATSDPHDVAPEGLRQAGGQVERFGMPVDPGNLLFLGDLAGRPVVGLPGCVRSPVMNGADWVMERLLCGVPVTSADIARMGVGGLLKEIPSRPQPRERK
ncbi:hypothetical protein PSA7680_00925 [Pseudoruegeria aquimaris]|uniref:MoaB/Mog domain-containing protein n=1 Tax=Pseudoruegeria aquimaris TaxID=393663 RepID=A0A1Y5RQE9_9RHOB|nr:molybdopterin-binding protein [Pseudoruegeria aquimaris]SLN22807.1 hypothetical protein PSA7680_00925 [Pseudoruegeria aquimaris]